MASFEIIGGKPLKGELTPQGAKNEALQVLCAPLLTAEKVTISNVPDIIDVNKLISLLQAMGVKVEKVEKGTYIFQAKEIDLAYLETEDFKKRASALRGSIMIVGPLLARFGKGFIPKPGGDKIGRRRLDTHFEGFTLLGAKFNYDAGEHLPIARGRVNVKSSPRYFVKTERKTRAIAVQLSPQTVKRLDELAANSGMSRHRYMILILERAVKANVTVREEVAFSNEHP